MTKAEAGKYATDYFAQYHVLALSDIKGDVGGDDLFDAIESLPGGFETAGELLAQMDRRMRYENGDNPHGSGIWHSLMRTFVPIGGALSFVNRWYDSESYRLMERQRARVADIVVLDPGASGAHIDSVAAQFASSANTYRESKNALAESAANTAAGIAAGAVVVATAGTATPVAVTMVAVAGAGFVSRTAVKTALTGDAHLSDLESILIDAGMSIGEGIGVRAGAVAGKFAAETVARRLAIEALRREGREVTEEAVESVVTQILRREGAQILEEDALLTAAAGARARASFAEEVLEEVGDGVGSGVVQGLLTEDWRDDPEKALRGLGVGMLVGAVGGALGGAAGKGIGNVVQTHFDDAIEREVERRWQDFLVQTSSDQLTNQAKIELADRVLGEINEIIQTEANKLTVQLSMQLPSAAIGGGLNGALSTAVDYDWENRDLLDGILTVASGSVSGMRDALLGGLGSGVVRHGVQSNLRQREEERARTTPGFAERGTDNGVSRTGRPAHPNTRRESASDLTFPPGNRLFGGGDSRSGNGDADNRQDKFETQSLFETRNGSGIVSESSPSSSSSFRHSDFPQRVQSLGEGRELTARKTGSDGRRRARFTLRRSPEGELSVVDGELSKHGTEYFDQNRQRWVSLTRGQILRPGDTFRVGPERYEIRIPSSNTEEASSVERGLWEMPIGSRRRIHEQQYATVYRVSQNQFRVDDGESGRHGIALILPDGSRQPVTEITRLRGDEIIVDLSSGDEFPLSAPAAPPELRQPTNRWSLVAPREMLLIESNGNPAETISIGSHDITIRGANATEIKALNFASRIAGNIELVTEFHVVDSLGTMVAANGETVPIPALRADAAGRVFIARSALADGNYLRLKRILDEITAVQDYIRRHEDERQDRTALHLERIAEGPNQEHYGPPSEGAPVGTYFGRPIIASGMTVTGGIYLSGGKRGALVVDPADPDLRNAYDEFRRLHLVDGMSTEQILRAVHDYVDRKLGGGAEGVREFEASLINAGDAVRDLPLPLGVYVRAGRGVCAQKSLLTGFLVESLADSGILHASGEIIRDSYPAANQLDWDRHAFYRVEFGDRREQVRFIDSARQQFGDEEALHLAVQNGERFWPYLRVSDMARMRERPVMLEAEKRGQYARPRGGAEITPGAN